MKGKLVHTGKVRDIYDCGDTLLMVATDRLSAFDRALTNIPHKAQVLNLLSAWWFEQTSHIMPNHFISCSSDTSMEVKKCDVFPLEVIVRGFLTGSTATSIWNLYQSGEREFFETTLPDGLCKNTAFSQAILTPTTKQATHDCPLTIDTLYDWIDGDLWQQISVKALELFSFGQQLSLEKGLILVDTKYEFGLDKQGNLLLVDECHTPDSSRYWLKNSYQESLDNNQEPENFDKEFLRLWYRENCNPYHDRELPEAPVDLVEKVSKRYIYIYQCLTGGELCAASLES